ncbi:MAG: prepilin-type N-terminal cleavage/methylation domain-containing protein [Cyanobacteriota bacterium]|nr:prepilin-type N-terminal cleavage/methylation domain-containing protein [Cyanobacteriota bacterium]
MKLSTRSQFNCFFSTHNLTPRSSNSNIKATAGYTLHEILIAIAMIAIFSGIAVPSWLGFISRYQLRTGASRVYWAMQTARSEAKRQRISVQASFREKDNRVQWAVHLPSIPPSKLSDTAWETLPPGVLIDDLIKEDQTSDTSDTSSQKKDDDETDETTLPRVEPGTNKVKNSGTVYRALFNYKGCPVYKPIDECTQTSLRAKGRLGLKHENLKKEKRCVILSTLLGAIRIGENQLKPESGKKRHCY